MLAEHEVLTYLARHEYLLTFETITFGPQNIISELTQQDGRGKKTANLV